MSDFFTRLAGRTLGRTPVIQPFIPPKFALGATEEPEAHGPERPASGKQKKSEAARGEKTPQERAFPTLFSARPEPVSAVTAERHSMLVRTSVGPVVQSRASVTGRDVHSVAADPGTGIEPVRKHRAVRGPTDTVDAGRPGHGPAQGIRETLSPVMDRDRSMDTTPDGPAVSAPSLRQERGPAVPECTTESKPDTPSARRGPHERAGREGPGPETTTESDGHARPPSIVRPSPDPRGTPAGPMAERGRPAAAEPSSRRPTIRVTIGRVEVRAVLQGTPPPQPAAARRGPALSLDDYLARRNGGG
jgi:hypothetical protein